MLEWLETKVSADSYKPVEVDERILKSMCYEEVFIIDYTHLCPTQPRTYFKNMVPEFRLQSVTNAASSSCRTSKNSLILKRDAVHSARTLRKTKELRMFTVVWQT